MDIIQCGAPLDSSFQKEKRELISKGSLGRRRKPSRANLKLLLTLSYDPEPQTPPQEEKKPNGRVRRERLSPYDFEPPPPPRIGDPYHFSIARESAHLPRTWSSDPERLSEAGLGKRKQPDSGRSAVLIQTWERRTRNDSLTRPKQVRKSGKDQEKFRTTMPDSKKFSSRPEIRLEVRGLQNGGWVPQIRDSHSDDGIQYRKSESYPPVIRQLNASSGKKSVNPEPEWVSLSKKLCAKFVEGHIDSEPDSADSTPPVEPPRAKQQVPQQLAQRAPASRLGQQKQQTQPHAATIPVRRTEQTVPKKTTENTKSRTSGHEEPPWIDLSRKLCTKFIEEHIEYPFVSSDRKSSVAGNSFPVEPNGDVRIVEKIGKPKGARTRARRDSEPEWVRLSRKLRAKFIESHIDDPDTISLENQLNASDPEETSSGESFSENSFQTDLKKNGFTYTPKSSSTPIDVKHDEKRKRCETFSAFENRFSNNTHPSTTKECSWECKEMDFDQESNSGTFHQTEAFEMTSSAAKTFNSGVTSIKVESGLPKDAPHYTTFAQTMNSHVMFVPECYNNDVRFAPCNQIGESSNGNSEKKVISVQYVPLRDPSPQKSDNETHDHVHMGDSRRDGPFFNLTTWEEAHYVPDDVQREETSPLSGELRNDLRSKSMDDICDRLPEDVKLNKNNRGKDSQKNSLQGQGGLCRSKRSTVFQSESFLDKLEFESNDTDLVKASSEKAVEENADYKCGRFQVKKSETTNNSQSKGFESRDDCKKVNVSSDDCQTTDISLIHVENTSSYNGVQNYSNNAFKRIPDTQERSDLKKSLSYDSLEVENCPTNDCSLYLKNENFSRSNDRILDKSHNLVHPSSMCDIANDRLQQLVESSDKQRGNRNSNEAEFIHNFRSEDDSSKGKVINKNSVKSETNFSDNNGNKGDSQHAKKVYKCNGVIPNSRSNPSNIISERITLSEDENNHAYAEIIKKDNSKNSSKPKNDVRVNEYANVSSSVMVDKKTQIPTKEKGHDAEMTVKIGMKSKSVQCIPALDNIVESQSVNPAVVRSTSTETYEEFYPIETFENSRSFVDDASSDLKMKSKSCHDISRSTVLIESTGREKHLNERDFPNRTITQCKSEVQFQEFASASEIPLCAKLVSKQNGKRSVSSASSSCNRNTSPCSVNSHVYEDMFKDTTSCPSESETASWTVMKNNSYYINGRSSSMNDLDYSDSCSLSVKCDYASSGSERSTQHSRHSSCTSSSFYVNLRDYDSHMLEPSLNRKRKEHKKNGNPQRILNSNPPTPESLRHLFTSPFTSNHSASNRVVSGFPADSESHYYSTAAAATSSAFKHGFDPPSKQKPKKADRSSSIKIKDIAHGIILTFRRFQNYSKSSHVSPTHYVDVSHLAEFVSKANTSSESSKSKREGKSRWRFSSENGSDSGYPQSDSQTTKAKRSSSDLAKQNPPDIINTDIILAKNGTTPEKKKSKTSKKSSNPKKSSKSRSKSLDSRAVPTVSRKVQQMADGTLYLVTTVSGDTTLPGVYSDSPDTSSEISGPIKTAGESNC